MKKLTAQQVLESIEIIPKDVVENVYSKYFTLRSKGPKEYIKINKNVKQVKRFFQTLGMWNIDCVASRSLIVEYENWAYPHKNNEDGLQILKDLYNKEFQKTLENIIKDE